MPILIPIYKFLCQRKRQSISCIQYGLPTFVDIEGAEVTSSSKICFENNTFHAYIQKRLKFGGTLGSKQFKQILRER